MRYYSCSSFSWCAIFYLASLLHFQVTNCHRTSGYSHESEISGENSKWMSSLPDNVPLSSLSLPGTHESLSRGHGGAIAECQTLSLESQLRAGIRVLDVRCRHIEDSFAIHHGMIFLHIMFGDVLQQLEAFLKNNPSETILMRVKEEYEAVNVTGTFEETFSHYYNENPTLFWHTDNETGERPDPTLRSVRGKVVILDNFSSTTKYGLNYGDSGQFIIQDDFKFSTNWDLYDKWMKVKDQVRNADVSRRSGENKFFLNYLSGSFGSFPYFVASGHVTSGTGEHRLSTGLTTLTARDKYPDFPRLDCILKVCTISFEGAAGESTKNFFKTLTSWVDPDKIPSVEVKVGYDGVSVSTGPSREQIYWTIGVCIGGFFVGIFVLATIILVCIHCKKRRQNQMELSLWNAPRGGHRLNVDIPGSFMILNPTLGTPVRSFVPGPSSQPQIFATTSSKEFVNVGHGMWARK